jgi:D-beta-D-heptose 7-phosphate kinase/D-beta-D-heptose 1-phosphate adenosyltransferase
MNTPLPLQELSATLGAFPKLRVLVLGDLLLDEYLEGEMFEISREGPIPVVKLASRVRTAGAAGNLACSLKNLGAEVSLVSIVGEDSAGEELTTQLEEKNIGTDAIIRLSSKPTLTYTKIRAGVANAPAREILRLDVLPDEPIDSSIEDRVLSVLGEKAGEVDAIIVLDQVHHLVTGRILDELPAIAASHNLFLQGSSRERLEEFHDFSLVIPNDQEAREALGNPGQEIPPGELAGKLKQQGSHREVLLTLGPGGMAALGENCEEAVLLPSLAGEVVDVTGAGDAVSSAVLLGRLAGWDLHSAAAVASHCASVAISRTGTHHVTLEELQEALGGN